ncbi:hypothetical protein J2Y48_002903 [Mycoplana sp. BE70]|uniref:hypothetical protein n=1 Tax=Mycoplana sp. BE70 TaxID=2817775 RepID=UPI0028566759|nr:hypothetical protein [Mycoplana sp. BE70]MDR6757606.1 hypothetical protein [Mycoplana sp. BE70]
MLQVGLWSSIPISATPVLGIPSFSDPLPPDFDLPIAANNMTFSEAKAIDEAQKTAVMGLPAGNN